MKKIKLFLITLLSVVGVMNLMAQEIETVTIGSSTGEINNGRDTWTSTDTFEGGYKLSIVDENANALYGMNFSDGNLNVHVADFLAGSASTQTIEVKAPLGWIVTGCKFKVSTTRARVQIGGDDVTEYNNTSLNQTEFTFNVVWRIGSGLSALNAGDATFSDFEVTLERKYMPSINDNPDNTVNGHWLWVQNTPQKGNIYKIVNATSNENSVKAIGAKPNNTVSDGSDASESSVLVSDMVKAGEWLLGNDEDKDGITITNVNGDQIVGIYESHVEILGFKIGANWNQHWRISNLQTMYGVDGYYIDANRPFGHCYLKLSGTFAAIQEVTGWEVGDMGWTGQQTTWPFTDGDINTIVHLWNFYSIEQYDCYVDFMTAYNAFDELPYDIYYNNPDYPEYTEVYDIVNEAGKRWQGDTDETREATYDIIDRMLNVIATIKGGHDKDEKPEGVAEEDWPINNPGSEHTTSFDGWRSRRITTDNTNISKAVKKLGDAHSDAATFELQNATMSQMVSGIKSGVYELSVYWKSDNAEAEISLQAKSSAETVNNTFFVKDKATEAADANGYRKAVVEVVVVDKNVTVGATVNTYNGASVYLDDFKLEYVCKNYWELNEAGDTRVYRGVFLGSEADAPVGNIKKEHPNNEAKAIVTDDVPYADIAQAYFVSFEFDNSANPNGLCYTKAESTKKIQTKVKPEGTDVDDVNVVRGHVNKDGEIVDGECKMLALVDGHPYSAKADFTATAAHYKMNAIGQDEVEGYQYGSLMLPYEAVIPSETEAYTVAINGEVLELTKVTTTKIPANTPVLVTMAKDFDGAGNVKRAEAGQYKVSSLVGVYTLGVKAPVGSYVLQKQNGHLAYYQVKENKRDKLTINPFRSYLEGNENSAKVPSFDIVFDETDGLSEIIDGLNNGEIYDLGGRRVEKMVRGIYIVNGKKVLVK